MPSRTGESSCDLELRRGGPAHGDVSCPPQLTPGATHPLTTEGGGRIVAAAMGVRLLIHLAAGRTTAGVPADAARLLADAQATVQPSHPELQDVYIATVPDTTALEPLIAALSRCDGVRHVEPDAFRTTSGDARPLRRVARRRGATVHAPAQAHGGGPGSTHRRELRAEPRDPLWHW
jgi:hypothetical protein